MNSQKNLLISLSAVTLLWLTVGSLSLHAQDTTALHERLEEVAGKAESTAEALTTVENDVASLKKLKISGYVQSQWEYTDNVYSSALGLNFINADIHNRFLVRRGRVKFTYKANDWSEFVIQPDLTNTGVTLKDAYVKFTEHYFKTFSFTMGQFNRPWYETEYSSSSRETPERARVTTTLFPGEREVGAMMTVAPTISDLNLKLDLAAFNGNFRGGAGPTSSANDLTNSSEVDNGKDIMSRLSFTPLSTEDVTIDLDGMFYYGGMKVANDTVIHGDGYAVSPTKDTLVTKEVRPGTAGSISMGDKQFIGGEAQVFINSFSFGGTILKGGFITGQLPSASGTTMSTKKISGYYAYFVQNIGKNDQLVVKYEGYDPNTERAGDQIRATNDIMFTTLGVGINHYFDSNVRATFYYEMPKNETSTNVLATSFFDDGKLSGNFKDNKFTFRLQYKF